MGSTTGVDEIADGIFRISTWVPNIGEDGFTSFTGDGAGQLRGLPDGYTALMAN